MEQVVYFAAYIITEVDDAAKEEAKEQLSNEFKNLRKKIQDEAAKATSEAAAQKDKAKIDKIEKDSAQRLDELDDQNKKTKEQLDGIRITAIYSELEYRELSTKFGQIFKAGIGAEAIRHIIQHLDLAKLIKELEKDVYKIEVESGKAIELTEDHLVQTDKGWKQVKDLSGGESVYILGLHSLFYAVLLFYRWGARRTVPDESISSA
jgi:hypothetical protein